MAKKRSRPTKEESNEKSSQKESESEVEVQASEESEGKSEGEYKGDSDEDSDEESDEDSDQESDEESTDGDKTQHKPPNKDKCEKINNEIHDNNEQTSEKTDMKRKKKKIRKIDLDQAQDFNDKLKKRGIVYLARIPPGMGPSKVKSLMSDLGEVTRVYLKEEDKTTRKRRKKVGGSGGKRYLEGWVEFADRRIAKRVGANLNMTPISIQKHSKYCNELWTLKFVRKLTWSHLTDLAVYERRMREQKLMKELLQAKKENAQYVARVEEGHQRDMIQERRRKRAEKTGLVLPEANASQQRQFYIRQQATYDDHIKKDGNTRMLGALFK